jgi:O-antigen ligase
MDSSSSRLRNAEKVLAPNSASCLTVFVLMVVAIGLPALLAYSLPPSPTLLNQASAICGWGLVVSALARSRDQEHAIGAVACLGTSAHLALLLVGIAALASWASGLPAVLALPALGLVTACAVVLTSASSTFASPSLWGGLFVALLAAGAVSTAIGVTQVFAPDEISNTWVARNTIPGRAAGNLRQPNHLSTLLVWSAVAAIPLLTASLQRGLTLASTALGAVFCLLLFGVVLSGSRTGLLGVFWLLGWGLVDRSLPRSARVLLLTSPLICLTSNLMLSWWSHANEVGALGLSTRIGATEDISSNRFAIWRDAWNLVSRDPWLGVGFGEFNFAWTLTPSPNRPTEFFDHTHNLPLHLAAELGVPFALLVVGLLLRGLWQAFVRSRDVPGPEGITRRACLVMVLLMGWHSMLEYPLWYAYFLLPTAFMWGLCLRPHEPAAKDALANVQRPAPWLAVGGVVMIVAAAVTLWDYSRVVAIFAPKQDNRATLLERIVEGGHSWLFAHHADYALVTSIDGAGMVPGAFDRATHFLLDTRLMIAWSTSLAARGEVDRARHIAARLREFRNPGAAEFFAPCDDAAVVDKPFQCSPPERLYGWRDFLDVK